MSITSAVRRVARLLKQRSYRVVFAESCTGGLVSGALTKVAGISEFHCGGMVVYRNATKTAYLEIPGQLLASPGPVSAQVTELMAQRVLERTPEADVAAAVTGHLGPNAPPELDGLAFAAVAWRHLQRPGSRLSVPSLRDLQPPPVHVKQLQCRKTDSRAIRQRWVVERVLEFLGDELEQPADERGQT